MPVINIQEKLIEELRISLTISFLKLPKFDSLTSLILPTMAFATVKRNLFFGKPADLIFEKDCTCMQMIFKAAVFSIGYNKLYIKYHT